MIEHVNQARRTEKNRNSEIKNEAENKKIDMPTSNNKTCEVGVCKTVYKSTSSTVNRFKNKKFIREINKHRA